MPLKNHCCVLRESHSALQELRGALQESRTVPGTSLAFFNSFQKPHMLTALVMAFDNAEIRTVISGHKRTVVLVCYVQEVFAHSTVHLLLYYTRTTDIPSPSLYETHSQAFSSFPYAYPEMLQCLYCFPQFGFLVLCFLLVLAIYRHPESGYKSEMKETHSQVPQIHYGGNNVVHSATMCSVVVSRTL